MTASNFQSFSSATKMLHLCFCICVPRGALRQWISLVPNQKVTWSTFVLLLHFFTHGASKEQHKSNSSPYSIVRIKWNIWRCFEKYKALWKHKALLLALGEGHFLVFITFSFTFEKLLFQIYSHYLWFQFIIENVHWIDSKLLKNKHNQ